MCTCFRAGLATPISCRSWPIPKCCPKLSIRRMSASNPTSDASSHRLILIVDDEPGVRAMVHTALRLKDHFRILEAGNATDALALASQHQPDLVLLDVALP